MRKAAAIALLCGGCYYLQGNEIRQGIAATYDALEEGKTAVAAAYIAPTREIAGEPNTVPPLNVGAAQLWGEQVKAKARRIRQGLMWALNRFGLPAVAGGGPLALLVGWATTRRGRQTAGRLARHIVQLGKGRLDDAKGDSEKEKDILDDMKKQQAKLGIRTVVRKELKNAGQT